MEHLRIRPDIDSDPDLMGAGWWGAQVYQLLLRVSALKDLRGRVPLKYQNPAWLARLWNLSPSDLPAGLTPEKAITWGVDGLLRVGQVRRDGEDMLIGGWDKFYNPPKSGQQRTKDWRNRQSRDAGDETPSRVTEPETPRHGDATYVPTHPPTYEQKELHALDESSRAPEPPVALVEPPVGRKKAKTPRAADPRHAPVREMLCRVFAEVHGRDYGFAGGKDARAVTSLLALGSDAEIERRWRTLLTAKERWDRVDSIAQLPGRWNSEAANGHSAHPPGRDVGRPKSAIGDCAVCGPSLHVTAVWGQALCTICVATWTAERVPTNEEATAAWVAARKERAA